MSNATLTWQLVDEAGAELGASDPNRLKWRQRGVPPKWQIDIAEHLRGRGLQVSFGDFNALPLPAGRIAA